MPGGVGAAREQSFYRAGLGVSRSGRRGSGRGCAYRAGDPSHEGGAMIDPIREANIGQPGIEADEHGDPVGKDPRQSIRPSARCRPHCRCRSQRDPRDSLDCRCGSPGRGRDMTAPVPDVVAARRFLSLIH